MGVIVINKTRHFGWTGVSALALIAAACPALAAPAAAPAMAAATPDDSSADYSTPDILVTAERTNVTLQKATLSVTAITAAMLSQNNITEITGLNGTVPGLVIAKSGGGERQISIRGVGSETPENPQTQPGVSVHVDGVYIFNSIAANAAFIDVSQIEVLRGPQGTMYGQGSTGGTINIVSKQPEMDKLTGSANVGYGNYNLLKADAALNVPIGDTFAIRGAVQRYKHDGYAHATDVAGQPNYDLDDANEWSGKLSAKWAPTDKFSILLSTIQYRGNNNAPAQKNILDPNPDPRALTQDFPGKSYVRTQLYYGVAKYDLGFATFSSITGYQTLKSVQSWDGDGLNSTLFSAVTGGNAKYDHIATWTQNSRSWTQEFNLASNPDDGRFKWIVGGVYLKSTNDSYINEYRSNTGNGLNPALPQDTLFSDPLVKTFTFAQLSSITRKAYAAYAQGTYKLSDQLSLTAGARLNHDKYGGVSDSQSGPTTSKTSGAYLQPEPTIGTKTQRITGKLAIDYDFSAQNMVYASYTRGFKPGGINTSAAEGNSSYTVFGWADGIKPTFAPETLDSFEIGTKNRFFNNTLQLNASGFVYLYKGLQFLEDDAIIFADGTSNAGNARVLGLEFEGEWRATRHVRLEGSASLLQSKFTSDYFALDPSKADAAQAAAGWGTVAKFYQNFFAASTVRRAASQNIKGNRLPKMPTFQGSAAISWTGEVGPGELTGRAQYIYRGKFQSRVFNNSPNDNTPSYSQVNLFANYNLAKSGLHASVTVTNVFNTVGVNSRFTDPYGSSQISDTYIPPRQAIFSVGYNF